MIVQYTLVVDVNNDVPFATLVNTASAIKDALSLNPTLAHVLACNLVSVTAADDD